MAVIDKNKLLGSSEKGGELMVRPTTSLVGSPGGKITETSDEKDVVYTISTKLVKIDKFLKGNLDAEKVAQKKEQKQKEDELRAEQEADKEKPDDKKQRKETPKSLIPKMSFLDGIKKFLGDVLMGWLVFRLIKFLPKIVSFLKPAAAFVEWVLKWGGKLLDGLITLVDWGYKAVEATRGFVGNLFGEKGVEAFDNITGTLNTVFNLIGAIGLAALAFTNEWGNQDGGQDRRNRIKNKNRQERLKDPEYKNKFDERVKSRRQYKRQQTIDKWKKRFGIDQPKVQGPKQPNLFDKMKKRFTPDPTAVKKPSIGQRLGNWWESGAAGRKKLGTQITEGAANLQKRTTSTIAGLGDSFNKNISKPLGDLAEKFSPKQMIRKLADSDLAGSKGAKRLIALIESPVLKKWLGRAPLIGDAIIFISDLLRGVHWTRALMRTATAFGIDWGFGALISASVAAAPFTGGASLALTGALTAAYMAADQLGGWALKGEDYHQGDGIGQVLGDKLANAIGLPKKAGMAGEEGKAWDSMFGGSGTPKVDPEKVMKGLTDKEKEAIARVDGKNVKDDKDKNKISKEFGMKGKTYDLSKTMGGLSREDFEALGTRDQERINRRISIWRNQNKEEWVASVKGNANNIVSTNGVSNKVNGVSSSASYEEGAEETIVVKSGSQQEVTPDTKTNESLTPVIVGGGGEGDSEVADALYKGG